MSSLYHKLQTLTAELVSPTRVWGLRGRKLVHPSRERGKTRTIVFVYGIHGSLERFYGVIHYLARFGEVVAPDLPGFGGMEPVSKIGRKASIDAHADYLAEFLKHERPDGPVTLLGLSYGFVVITRMLARHPELVPRVQMTVSAMGLADGTDIRLRGPVRWGCEVLFAIGRLPGLGQALQYLLTRPWLQRLMYTSRNPKMKALAPGERPDFIDFETYLWKANHMQTYAICMHELFNLRQSDHIPLEVHHIATIQDHWLNVGAAERHIGRIYSKVIAHRSNITNHGGVAYADEAEAKDIIPPSFTEVLEAL